MPIEINGTVYITVKEVARRLNRGRTTIKRWVHKGLPYGLGRI